MDVRGDFPVYEMFPYRVKLDTENQDLYLDRKKVPCMRPQSFAFDLAHLYMSEIEETKSGRKFQFGPSRNNIKAIRILDRDGQEQFLATIRFYE
ncbi:hypothetical protein AALA00_07070 [Lachnospiraceae bacterium 46-15]